MTYQSINISRVEFKDDNILLVEQKWLGINISRVEFKDSSCL